MGVPDACQYKAGKGIIWLPEGIRFHRNNGGAGKRRITGFRHCCGKQFPHYGRPLHGNLSKTWRRIKKAAALTNMSAHVLDERVGNAIVQACDEI